MKTDMKATVYYCDGCGRDRVQLEGHDLPSGYYFELTEVNVHGADHGRLYACNERCIPKAVRRRHEVWEPEKRDPDLADL